jgi:hypothetical protein
VIFFKSIFRIKIIFLDVFWILILTCKNYWKIYKNINLIFFKIKHHYKHKKKGFKSSFKLTIRPGTLRRMISTKESKIKSSFKHEGRNVKRKISTKESKIENLSCWRATEFRRPISEFYELGFVEIYRLCFCCSLSSNALYAMGFTIQYRLEL